jgi:hypothetical protein
MFVVYYIVFKKSCEGLQNRRILKKIHLRRGGKDGMLKDGFSMALHP